MKTFRRIVISLTFSLLLFFTISFTAFASDVDTQGEIQGNYFASSLDNLTGEVDITALEDYINESIFNCVSNIDVSQFNIPYSRENFNAITDYIYDDIPEAFHVKSISGSYVVGEPSTFLEIIVNYKSGYTQEIYAEKINQCNLATKKILDGIIDNEALTDAEKLLLIHDRLVVLCEYDYENYLNNTIPDESYTIYGALVNGTAVCQGYSEAFKYLLEKIGIYSEICTSRKLSHAWNIVYLDGIPYHVDVTFDDPVLDVTGRVFHNNFLLSDKAIKEADHDANDYFSGATDTRYDNGFWQDSTTQIVCIDNELYYIDEESGNLIKNSDKSTLINTNDAWGYWYGNYSMLATDGRSLYYSSSDSIHQYNLTTKAAEVIFTPDFQQYENYCIYGFTYKNGAFYYDLSTSPNYSDSTERKLTFTYTDSETIPTGPVLIEIDGALYYFNNGEIDYSETLVSHNDQWYYVNNGKADKNYTGLVYYGSSWFYVSDGVLDWSYTGLTYYGDTWFYVNGGVLDWGYTGLTYYGDAWFYVNGGVLDWSYTGLTYYNGAWFFVNGGVLDWNYTGLAEYNGTFFHVANGMLDWNYSGLSYYYGHWFYVTNGVLDWSYTGYTYYCGAWYYVENGYLDWSKQ